MSEEVLTAMGTPIKGFFNGADIIVEAMTSASTTAQGAPVEVLIPSPRPGPVEESTQIERVGESIPTPAEPPTVQKEVTPAGASQAGSASPTTPLVILASDPFVALSQAVKDGSSLVVTLSSIPSSFTHGPDAGLSSNERSEEAFEDSKGELVMRKRLYDFDEDVEHEIEAMVMCLLSLKDLLFLFFLSFPGNNF